MNAYLLSFNDSNLLDQWDFGFLHDFLKGKTWTTPDWQDFNIKSVNELSKDKTALVAIPARHHAEDVDKINKELEKIDNVVLFLMGDEEADFPVEKIKHKSIHIWVQNPHPGRHDDYNKIGTGYPPQLKEHVEYREKKVDIFFSGQLTHRRRHDMNNSLTEWAAQGNTSDVTATKGFTQGLAHKDYYRRMCEARIAPAPAGAVIPDSFRLFEALECMCVVLADDRNSQDTISGYWNWIFGDVPFIQIDQWDELVGVSYRILNELNPILIHRQTQWWIKYKRDFAYRVMEQLNG